MQEAIEGILIQHIQISTFTESDEVGKFDLGMFTPRYREEHRRSDMPVIFLDFYF